LRSRAHKPRQFHALQVKQMFDGRRIRGAVVEKKVQ